MRQFDLNESIARNVKDVLQEAQEFNPNNLTGDALMLWQWVSNPKNKVGRAKREAVQKMIMSGVNPTTIASKTGLRGVLGAVGRMVPGIGSEIGAAGTLGAGVAGGTAAVVAGSAVIAAAVAAGTMVYLQQRNKNGLRDLKNGMWDGTYPWDNVQVVNNGGGKKKPVHPVQPQPAPQPEPVNPQNERKPLDTVPAMAAAPQAQATTRDTSGDKLAQQASARVEPVNKLNNPRLAGMAANGRSPEAISNAAQRQANRTDKNIAREQKNGNIPA